MSVANQLFSVLICLRLGLLVADVCMESVKVHIAVCLQHGSVSFLKNLNFSSHFLHVGKLMNGCPEVLKSISLIHASSVTVMRLNANDLQD